MKNQILALFTFLLMASCISTNRLTGYVEPKFQETKTLLINDNFVFDFSDLKHKSSPVLSTKIKSFFIPAILYWGWNKTIKCEIDPNIVGQSFQESFLYFADSLKLQEKLQGRKLEIKLEKIPNSFVYTHKGNAIIFIYAYTVSDIEAIFPQVQNLWVSYRLILDGKIIKEDELSATNNAQSIMNDWKSTKKFTWFYVDQFKKNNKSMTLEIVNQLLIEI